MGTTLSFHACPRQHDRRPEIVAYGGNIVLPREYANLEHISGFPWISAKLEGKFGREQIKMKALLMPGRMLIRTL